MLKVLGDPHLGKKFIHGVPLHRRGERERRQFARFGAHLADVGPGDLHVCLGDLFDKAVVPFAVILETAQLYREAAAAHPDVTYVVIAGNHDLARDSDRRSAFEILKEILRAEPNIRVVTEPHVLDRAGSTYVFYPYCPFRSAADLVRDFDVAGENIIAFGHWEMTNFGGSTHSLVPIEELAAKGITRAVTGHIHLPGRIEKLGVDVLMPGAMEPFSHAEDPDEVIYVTRALDAVLAAPDAYRDRCLRIQLQPGEELLQEIDCLQLSLQHLDETGVPDEEVVQLGDFDLFKLFDEAFEEAAVAPAIRTEILTRYHDLRAEQDHHA